jgi:hypothetical protein
MPVSMPVSLTCPAALWGKAANASVNDTRSRQNPDLERITHV